MIYTLLQINVCADNRSTGRIAEAIGVSAISHGWRSYIAYGRGRGKSESGLIKIGGVVSTLYHGILSRLFDGQGLGSKSATKYFLKEVDKINPNIIILHNIHGYYLNYPILFKYLKTKDIPVLWVLHDCWTFTGHCAHFVTYGCSKWKTSCEKCKHLNAYPKSVALDRSKVNFALKKRFFLSLNKLYLIPVSMWLKSLLKDSFFGGCNARVIYNGVDISVFKPLPELERKEKFIVLGVTNIWTKEKGYDDFIKLSKILDGRFYRIVLVGLSKHQINILPSNIEGVARADSVLELARYYASADVFLNMTYADTFPTTNLEALACGTPVITYRTGGSPEAISADTGVVVEQGDIAGVVTAVDSIRRIGKKYFTLKCRQRALELFDKDKNYEIYFDIFSKLV